MYALLACQLLCAAAAIGLGLAVRPRPRAGELLAEVVMVLAMLDIHLMRSGGLLPSAAWAGLLGGCALAVAVRNRVRPHTAAGVRGDELHPLGMVLGAALVLFAASGAPLQTSESHAHGSSSPMTATIVAVVVYGAVVVGGAVGRHRLDAARVFASLAGLATMAAMVVIG